MNIADNNEISQFTNPHCQKSVDQGLQGECLSLQFELIHSRHSQNFHERSKN
jgi:hypothetical protein